MKDSRAPLHGGSILSGLGSTDRDVLRAIRCDMDAGGLFTGDYSTVGRATNLTATQVEQSIARLARRGLVKRASARKP